MNIETIQIIVALLFLGIGIIIFQFAQKVRKKEKIDYYRYLCYSGLIMFVVAALFVYIGNLNISMMLAILLSFVSLGFAIIGKRK